MFKKIILCLFLLAPSLAWAAGYNWSNQTNARMANNTTDWWLVLEGNASFDQNLNTTANVTLNNLSLTGFLTGNASKAGGIPDNATVNSKGVANYSFGANNFVGTGWFNGSSGNFSGQVKANSFSGDCANCTGLPTWLNESTVVYNNSALIGKQSKLNFIQGRNTTFALSNDTAGQQINITINSEGDGTGAGGGDNITVNLDSALKGRQPKLNFLNGTNATIAISNDTTGGQINITISSSGGAITANTSQQLIRGIVNGASVGMNGEIALNNSQQINWTGVNQTGQMNFTAGITDRSIGAGQMINNTLTDQQINNLTDTKRKAFTLVFGDGVSTLTYNTTNTSYLFAFPMNFTVVGRTVIGDASGTATIEVYKNTSLPLLIANGFNGTEPIQLVNQQINTSTVLTGWNTSIASGEVFGANLTTSGTVKKVSITVWGYASNP